MGGGFAQKTKAFTYRYNQPNPTSGSPAVGHAAENWMMFLGTNTGYVVKHILIESLYELYCIDSTDRQPSPR